MNLLELNHYVLSSASLSLQIFRGLQSFFYTGSTLYLLCLSVDGMEAADDFLQTWMDIHYKISNPDVVIIFTQCFGKTRTANYHGIRAELVNRIKKIQKSVTGSNTKGNLIFESLTKLEKSLVSDSKPEVVIHFVDLHQKKGMSEVKSAIQNIIKCKTEWHSQFTKEHPSVRKITRNIRSSKTVLMNESDFLKVMKETKADEDMIDFLESKSCILRLYPVSEEPIICTDPRTLALLLVSVHVLDQAKVYQFDSRKFWGANPAHQPDPGILVKTLEDVAKQGILRESLIPLLWQNITDKEWDILHTIEILNQLGFFTPCDTRKSRDCDIVLETFPGLQSDRAFHLTQVGLTPNKGPTLSWTPTPAPDDIEITVRFIAVLGFPSGFRQLLVGGCRNVSWLHEAHYCWTWNDGVLVQYPTVTVRIDLLSDTVEMRGRTIALDHESEQEAVGDIWSFLSYSLSAIENIKRNWKNLHLERSIRVIDSSQGSGFVKTGSFRAGSLRGSHSQFISVKDIFNNPNESRKDLIPSKDLPSGCDYLGFVKHLAAKSQEDKNKTCATRKPPTRKPSTRIPERRDSALTSEGRETCPTKRKQITWILHKNPHQSKRMTSAEGVTGRGRKPLNSPHASVDITKNGDVKDRVLMDLVNGFVQEILRKGMAKYQEDIKSQREHNVTWSISAVTSFQATNGEGPDIKPDDKSTAQTSTDCEKSESLCRPSKLCVIL